MLTNKKKHLTIDTFDFLLSISVKHNIEIMEFQRYCGEYEVCSHEGMKNL